MKTIQFEAIAPQLLERVQLGATFGDASRELGVKVNTARAWLRKGRVDPSGTYGPFASAIGDAKAAQQVPNETGFDALTRDEWESHVAIAVRSGSVQAMKLWADTHEQTAEAKPADPFAEFDELASKREERKGA